MPSPSEARFREAVRRRDPAAWSELWDRYHDQLLRQACMILQPRQDPEGAVGELWLRAIRKAHTYKPAYPPYPWLAKICTNLCLDQRRSLKHWFATDSVEAEGDAGAGMEDGESDVDPRSDAYEARTRLRDALRRLPRRQREAVTLRFLFSLSVAEVAAALRVSHAAAGKSVLRGLERLREDAAEFQNDLWMFSEGA